MEKDISIIRINSQRLNNPVLSEWFVKAFFSSIDEEFKNSEIKSYKKTNQSQSKMVVPNMQHIIQDLNNSVLFCAFDEEKPVGYFLGLIKSYLAEDPSRVGYINGLFVESDYRRQGIAQMLWDQGKRWFSRQKLQVVELYVACGNDAARKFWAKNNYKPFEEVMFTTLD